MNVIVCGQMFKLRLLQVELRHLQHTNSQKHDVQDIYKKGNFALEVMKGNLSQQAEAQKVLKDPGLDRP